MVQNVDSATNNPEAFVQPLSLLQAGPCTNPVCLADKQALMREIESLEQKILSLQSDNTPSDSLIHRLNESNCNLESTLARELKRFEQERQSWISFKRNYATTVVEKLNDLNNQFIDQPKHPLARSIHPLITLTLETHKQSKEKGADLLQTQSHLSHPQDHKNHTSASISPDPGSPHRSTSKSTILDGSPAKLSVQTPIEKLCKKDKSESRVTTPIKQVYHRSPLNQNFLQASSSKYEFNKVSPRRSGVTPRKNAPEAHGAPSRNEISPRKKQLSPCGNRTTSARNGNSPRKNGRPPGRDRISPTRSKISPRKNGVTPGRSVNVSAARPDQLSLRSKPPADERVDKSHDFTPQLSRKRSATSATSRPKLPPSKWIRYSDRKARTGKVIWNDPEDSAEPSKCTKPQPELDQTVDDVFRVQAKQNPLPQDVISKPSKEKYFSVLEPSSKDLAITKEPDTESLTTPFPNRISSIVKSDNEHKDKPNYSLLSEQDLNSREEKIKEKVGRGQQSTSTNHDGDAEDSYCDEHLGQEHTKQISAERRQRSIQQSTSKNRESSIDNDSIENIHDRYEINPKNNFGVNHIFDEVARGKNARKNMRARGCECCSGYYEQAAKDLNQSEYHHAGDCSKIISEHQHRISRHRHFNPPPMTPPNYWQMGFPDTQEVENINQRAENNKKLKLKNIQLQAKDGTGPYKLKGKGK